jgi:hypothetical protein
LTAVSWLAFDNKSQIFARGVTRHPHSRD